WRSPDRCGPSRHWSPARRSRPTSRLLEIGALVHGQALEVAAEAVQSELHRAQAHPFPSAENAAAPGLHLPRAGDGEADGATELDAVRALVEIDQHGQGMGRRGGPKG